MSGGAKLDILTRINRAGVRPQEQVARVPVRSSSRPHVEVVEQFAKYAAEYRANVRQIRAADLPNALREQLGTERVILPPDLPREWQPEGLNAEEDRGQSAAELNSFEAVITACALAIAESGTLVLDHAAAQGRRTLTLIPDHHVCVVREAQVVEGMAEAVERLHSRVLAGQPLTFISGPSATSDIELSRVEGVHGPRRLDILLVASDGRKVHQPGVATCWL